MIAVDKPSGWLTHPSPIERRAPSCQIFFERKLGQRLFGVHRLDRPTSGVVLFARTAEAAAALQAEFRERRVEKLYWAVTRGFTPESGEIDSPLEKLSADRRRNVPGESYPAVTRYRRLATTEVPEAVGPYASARYSLVEARPLTGRSHQIRRHLRRLNHPLIGDSMYGDGKHNKFFREKFGVSRLCLAAREIALAHPNGNGELRIQAPLAADLAALCARLGWPT